MPNDFEQQPPRRVPREARAQSDLEIYLDMLNETPVLSADEEKTLARRKEAGIVEARETLIRHNLRFVVNIARGYTGKGLGLQDLIEEGNIGLLRAVNFYDPGMRTRFCPYANHFIRQAIERAIARNNKLEARPKYFDRPQ